MTSSQTQSSTFCSSPISSTGFSFETTTFGSSAPSTATPSFVITSAFRFPTTPPTFSLPSFGFRAAPSIFSALSNAAPAPSTSSAVSNVPTAAATTVTASTTSAAASSMFPTTASTSSSSSSPFSTTTTSAFSFVTGSALSNTTACFTQTTAPASTSSSTTTSSTFTFGTPSSSPFGFGGANGPLSSHAPAKPAFSGFGRATGFASTVTTTCPVLSASKVPDTSTNPMFSGFTSTGTTTTSASTSPSQFSFGTAASSSPLSSTPSTGLTFGNTSIGSSAHSTNLFSGGTQQIHWNPNAVSNAAPAFTMPSSGAPTATVTASPSSWFCTPNLCGTLSYVASTTFAATAATGLFSSIFPSTAASSSPLSTTTTSSFPCGTGSASTVTTTGPVLSASTAPTTITTSTITIGLLSSPAPTKPMFSGFASTCTTTTSASPAPALCSSQAATFADSTPSITTPEQETELAVLKVAYPDFCDFDRNKSEECFAADQIWAIYDYLDLMPRGYARINKVYSPFKVDLTWLEFVAGDIAETAWKRSGLPVACGKFKLSTTATTENIRAFSHKSFGERSIDKSYNIYPGKGETWALYKNWNIKWSSDPGNHREYEYEIVVVLSDYTNESGILVAHLVKLKGFVCLFKPVKNNGMASFQIPSNEMLRFSHRVPSFRTNGKERSDVPEGYFQLDTCSLPSNLEEESGFIDTEAETVDCNINGSLKSVSKEKHPMRKKRKNPDAESTLDGSSAGGNKSSRTNGEERRDVPEGYIELDSCSLPCNLEEESGFIDMEAETVDCNINSSLKSVSKEKHPMRKKRTNPDAESTLDGSSAGGNKSSRLSNGCYGNSNEEKLAAEASGLPLDKSKATSVSDVEKNVDAHAKEMSPDGVITIPSEVDEDIPSSLSSLKVREKSCTEFCNFDEERSSEKFKTGQIWALYCKLDKLPRNYAQIESVESLPVFKLAVKWLKSCDPPKGIIPWVDKEMPVSCGTFKVTSGEVVFNDSISFSHQLSKVPVVNNVHTIYPRAGEVWALYSKFRYDFTCSDLKKCEYNIVEILEVLDVQWIIVSVLQRVASLKAVFKAKEKEGLGSIAAVPWIELYRFSHQVPTYMLSRARYDMRSCWELDPRSLPVN